jgi:hypothetical protein
MAHAKNLRDLLRCTKWLNIHGTDLLKNHPEDFEGATGITVGEFSTALRAHIERCQALLAKI